MNKHYERILGEIGDASTQRSGKTPDDLVDVYSDESVEAMFRDICCQILADEPVEIRERFFAKYPNLKEYYRHRIPRKNKKTR